MIKAGDLRERIIIEQATESRDATTGAVSYTWATYATVWASVKEVSGDEKNEDNLSIGNTIAEVIIRKDSTTPVNQKMRVNHHNYYWDILEVLEYEFNEGYKLKIRKRDNNAS